jgi:hypothetical protein
MVVFFVGVMIVIFLERWVYNRCSLGYAVKQESKVKKGAMTKNRGIFMFRAARPRGTPFSVKFWLTPEPICRSEEKYFHGGPSK